MLHLIKNTVDYTIVTHNTNLIFCVFKKAVPVQLVEDVRKTQDALLAANGGEKLFFFGLTLKNVDIPRDEGLIAMTDWIREAEGKFHAVTDVVLDTGWRGFLVMSVTWAMVKAARYPVPVRPTTSYRAAVKWLVEDFPEGKLNFNELVEDVETLLEAVIEEQQQIELAKKKDDIE